MDIKQVISKYANHPIPHQLISSILKDYKRPNDKIKALTAEGVLQPVKRGLYIVGPRLSNKRPEGALLANIIYGPSYVSLDTALSYYGLIPERVYEISSMTTKAKKEFNTEIGIFTYTHLPLPYYAFGLNMIKLSPDQRAILASPEKALCDKVVVTPGINLRSLVQTSAYLMEDLRIEKSSLKNLNIEMMESWLTVAPKKESLNILIKTIKNL